MTVRKGSDAYYRKLAKNKIKSKERYHNKVKILNIYHPEKLKIPYKPLEK